MLAEIYCALTDLESFLLAGPQWTSNDILIWIYLRLINIQEISADFGVWNWVSQMADPINAKAQKTSRNRELSTDPLMYEDQNN